MERSVPGRPARVLRGDLGPSFRQKDFTVNELVAAGAPVSLTVGALGLMGFGLSDLFALKAQGAKHHRRRQKRFDAPLETPVSWQGNVAAFDSDSSPGAFGAASGTWGMPPGDESDGSGDSAELSAYLAALGLEAEEAVTRLSLQRRGLGDATRVLLLESRG